MKFSLSIIELQVQSGAFLQHVLLAQSELWPALEKTAPLCSTATIHRRPEPNADIAGWGVRSIAHKGRNAHEADSKIYLGDRKSSGDCLPGRLARGVLYLLLCETNLGTRSFHFRTSCS